MPAPLGPGLLWPKALSAPSKAIVYGSGSGRVPLTAMIRAGIVLDLLRFAVILTMLRLFSPLRSLV